MPAAGYGALDKLSLLGGVMTGDIVLPGNPAEELGAVPQQYVDSGFAAVLVYTAGAWPARSTSVTLAIWVGTVAPPSGVGGFVDGDIWINPSGGGSSGSSGGALTLTDSTGAIWLPVVSTSGIIASQCLPVLQDQAFGEILDQAGGVLE